MSWCDLHQSKTTSVRINRDKIGLFKRLVFNSMQIQSENSDYQPAKGTSASAILSTVQSLLIATLDQISFLYHTIYYFLLSLIPGIPPHAGPASQHLPNRSENCRPIVVITGTSTGIGRDAAMALAKYGYTVFCIVRKASDGESILGEFKQRLKEDNVDLQGYFFIMDLADESTIGVCVEKMIKTSRDIQQPIVALVNNAGMATIRASEMLTPQAIQSLYQCNLFGPMQLTRLLLPTLRENKGRVINIGSVAAIISPPWYGIYAGSKMAMRAWTDTLRGELVPHSVSVSLIEPGTIKTPILSKTSADFVQVYQHDDWNQATNGPDLRDVYPVEMLARIFKMGEETGCDVQHTTRAIVHAVTAKWNLSRYLVGMDARGLSLLIEYILPRHLVDLIVRVVFRVQHSIQEDIQKQD